MGHAPRPAIDGLDDELPQRSRLSLTAFGKAVLAEDFSDHNPIERWWGGTHLINDNLWRWSPTLVKP